MFILQMWKDLIIKKRKKKFFCVAYVGKKTEDRIDRQNILRN